MKTLLIDNYDSYTYNLYQLIAEISGEEPHVIKNNELSWEELISLSFDVVVISPGPGRPEKKEDFGICLRVIQELDKPILGVCLGQQGIYYAFGGEIVKGKEPLHGRLSKIFHQQRGLFQGLAQGFNVVHYHSLVCAGKVPNALQVDATTEDGVIMAISHKEKPLWGVQFHPESILTQYGKELLENFFHLSREYQQKNKKQKLSYEMIEGDFQGQDIFFFLSQKYPNVQWLDSSKVEEGLSRFSIFGISSSKRGYTLKYYVNRKQVEKIDQNGKKEVFQQSIFEYLKEHKKNWEYETALPFSFQLGYIGYFGYELKQDCVTSNRHIFAYPDAYWVYVDRAVVLDHKEKKLYILSYADDTDWINIIKQYCNTSQPVINNNIQEKIKEYPKVTFNKNKKEYIDAIKQCKKWIIEGETYEVCLTNRLEIADSIDAKKYYSLLRKISPAPYSAFLQFEEISIASSSMEKFLTIDQNAIIETKPIKGTMPRGKNAKQDQEYKTFLQEDIKNKAENLMIVDLLRNDLGKVCEIASVRVPALMQVETYSTVHQLVTTVQGKMAKNRDFIDVIQACFPGGSMTGAPKKRTLELIDRLENVARGVYSGCIGYISNNGCIDLNIVIRTAVIEKNMVSIGVGGAIIALSDEQEEFQEILLKAQGILKAFQVYYKGNQEEKIPIEGC